MKKGILSGERDGVSNVVATIMLLAIFMSLLGMITSTYLPAWAKTNESSHMLDAVDSFLDLKTTIDTQIIRSEVDTTMTTALALGSRGGPILGAGRSGGGIMVDERGSRNYIEDPTQILVRGRGAINYSTTNYYLSDQSYHYEHGAVILEQERNSVMKFAPNIHIIKEGSTIKFSSTLITIVSVGVTQQQGMGTVAIRTTLLTKEAMSFGQNDLFVPTDMTLRLHTSFTACWSLFLNNTCQTGGLPFSDYDITENVAQQWVEITVHHCSEFITRQAVVQVELEV